jgi:pantetheine-phosphate adenylyltransferase
VKRVGRAVLGGTFDHLHLGHESLLETAFRVGRSVGIGLTSERYLAAHPKPDGRRVQSYSTRRRALTAWLRAHHPADRWRVVRLDDGFGGSVAPGVGVLVVSAETVEGGRAVNAERRRRGLPSVPLVVVPLALADDLRPLASRRIRAGEIDAQGRRRTPLRVALRTSRAEDAGPARRAIRTVFPRAVVLPDGGSSGASAGRSAPTPLSGRVPDLRIDVVRKARGGWRATERSTELRLAPVEIPGNSAAALARGLEGLLRPRRRRSAEQSF